MIEEFDISSYQNLVEKKNSLLRKKREDEMEIHKSKINREFEDDRNKIIQIFS